MYLCVFIDFCLLFGTPILYVVSFIEMCVLWKSQHSLKNVNKILAVTAVVVPPVTFSLMLVIRNHIL